MTRAAATLRRLVRSLSARLNESFLTTACAAGAGMLQASSRRSGALNTSSGEPNSFRKRADSRAAIPGVNVNAIHDSDESSSIERPPPVEPIRQVTLLSSQFARILAIDGQVAAGYGVAGADCFPSWRAGAMAIASGVFSGKVTSLPRERKLE